jgi:hypothetical protein
VRIAKKEEFFNFTKGRILTLDCQPLGLQANEQTGLKSCLTWGSFPIYLPVF